MTDQQILIGIRQNDERAWKHICRNMKQGFVSILAQTFSFGKLSNEDIEDVFQESCILLMQKIKSGGFAISRDSRHVTLSEKERTSLQNMWLQFLTIYIKNMKTYL